MNNSQRLLIATLISTSVSSYTFAMQQNNDEEPLSNASGAYIVAGIGDNENKHTIYDTHDNASLNDGSKLKDRINTYKNRSFLNVGLGYGWQIRQKYYAAFEAGYQYMFNDHSFGYGLDYLTSYATGKTDYEIVNANQATATIKFGRTIWRGYLAYLQAGYAANWVKNNISYGIGLQDDDFKGTAHNFRQGLLLGGGIRVPVSQRFMIEAEYHYIDYFKYGYNVALPAYPNDNSAPLNFHFLDKSYSNNVSVSVIYKI